MRSRKLPYTEEEQYDEKSERKQIKLYLTAQQKIALAIEFISILLLS